MKKERFFGPLALWLFFIAAAVAATLYFSGQTKAASSSLSGSLARYFLSLPLFARQGWSLSFMDHCLRKTAHFCLYFLLGFGLGGLLLRQRKVPVFPAALLLGALYAATDELHQSFVDGRGALVSDVALDSCGAACGCLCVLAAYRLYRKIRK